MSTLAIRAAGGTIPERRTRRPTGVAAAAAWTACAALVTLALPARADAQHAAFVEALAEFTTALPGTFGDEGEAARGALDRLPRGLAEWDATLREYEANVEQIRPTASPRRIVEMHRTMGMFYLARGRADDAAREFGAAAGLEPGEPLFHVFHGVAHEAAGRTADAVAAYTAASTLNEADVVAAYMVGAASVRTGEPVPPATLAAIVAAVDRMVTGASAQDSEPFIVTALVPDDLTDAPNFVPARYAEGYAMVERGEYARAVDALRTASAQDPLLDPQPRPAIVHGAAALRAGRVAEAIEHFAAATREQPGSEPHRLLGVAYWLSADHERSIEHLERAIALRRDDERARLTLARVLEEIGDTARTEQVLAETVQAIPSSAAAHWRLARRLEAANRTEDAVREYEAAARIGVLTGETPLLLHIGELYRRDFDTVRAEAAFARAVALSPNHGVAHRERGRALLQLDRPDAALVELAAALLLDRDDYESCLTIGDIHLDAGRYAEAARVLTHATAIQPDRPEAYYALATALARAGRRDDAAPHLETFARLQAAAFDNQRRRIELSTLRLEADMLAQKGEFDRSAALWTRIVADAPDAASHAGLAAALAGQGQLEPAAAQYERAIALGAPATVFRQLAALYDRMGRPDAAARTRARLARTQQDALGGDGAAR